MTAQDPAERLGRLKPNVQTPRLLLCASLAILFATVWAASSLPLHGRSDLDLFFWPAAQTVVAGHPLSIYAGNHQGAGPYANGPLGLLPILPAAAIARLVGAAETIAVRTALVEAVAAVCCLIMAATALAIVRRGRGQIEWPLATGCAFLVAPTIWISVADFGHVEQPLLLTFVLGAGLCLWRQRVLLGSVMLGFALLTRETAILYLFPVALGLAVWRGGAEALRFTVVALLTAVIGFLPFILTHGIGVFMSVWAARGNAPIGGGSFWVLFFRAAWSQLVPRIDNLLVIGVSLTLTSVLVRRAPRRAVDPAGLCGLLAIAASCFPMLAKSAFPYYFVEPYVFAALWWLARPGPAWNWRVAVPFVITLDALLLNWAARLPFEGWGLIAGALSSGLMAVVIGLIGVDLLSTRPAATPTGPPSRLERRRDLSISSTKTGLETSAVASQRLALAASQRHDRRLTDDRKRAAAKAGALTALWYGRRADDAGVAARPMPERCG